MQPTYHLPPGTCNLAPGRTALHLAPGHLPSLYPSLLERGADPELADSRGVTPRACWEARGATSSSTQPPSSPHTPHYLQLDWSHHSGGEERRGAGSVLHTRVGEEVEVEEAQEVEEVG